MNVRFAFAVNYDNMFEDKHFGDADKYLVYKKDAGNIIFISEEENKFKLFDIEAENGLRNKGKAIIRFLKEKEINIIVSMRFCKNIEIVKEHFIPIKITLEKYEEVINSIIKYLHWIKDEWENNSSEFKLFVIKSGILKIAIDK